MKTQDWIVQLISNYLFATRTLTRRLAKSFAVADLLSGRRSKAIPRTGKTKEGLEFRFHGIGCTISDGTVLVDLDFAPNGNVEGFDAWRLHVFSKENPSLVELHPVGDVETALKDLAARSIIEAIPESSLYRLRQSTPGRSPAPRRA